MQALAHGAFPASTARRGLPDPGTGTTLRSGAGTSMSSTASTGAATRCPTAARGHRSPTTVPRGGHGTASAVEPDRGPLRSASATTIGRSRPHPDAPARRGTPPHPDEDLSTAGVGQAVQRLGGDPPRPARWRSAGFPTQVSPEVMTGLGSGTGADRQNRTGRLRRCPASGVAARCRMPAATAGGPPRVPPSHRLSSSRPPSRVWPLTVAVPWDADDRGGRLLAIGRLDGHFFADRSPPLCPRATSASRSASVDVHPGREAET